jgi:hypothetical protein
MFVRILNELGNKSTSKDSMHGEESFSVSSNEERNRSTSFSGSAYFSKGLSCHCSNYRYGTSITIISPNYMIAALSKSI